MSQTNFPLEQIQNAFRREKNATNAKNLARFFKTGPGEYGEGDIFLGIKVPTIRRYAKQFKDCPFDILEKLASSPFHEERFLALIILVMQYQMASKKKDEVRQTEIFNSYLRCTPYINNWDLVDVTVHHVIGAHLFKRDHGPLYKWAKSSNLWERRMAIISTMYFLRKNSFQDTIKIAEILLHDKEDLIHKAVGWLLREVGKRDLAVEEKFLQKYSKQMPRTMLRYAIEKFPKSKRLKYMEK